jgi:hypothetical protein
MKRDSALGRWLDRVRGDFGQVNAGGLGSLDGSFGGQTRNKRRIVSAMVD